MKFFFARFANFAVKNPGGGDLPTESRQAGNLFF
jgi:hypothetical protein